MTVPLEVRPHRVVSHRRETSDTVTLALAPADGTLAPFRPGQFNMVTALGVGEIPVSISGGPLDATGPLLHTVRSVGPVSDALCRARRGTVVGVRGPYGVGWGGPDELGPPGDLVIVGGGLGLAPLRPAIVSALDTAGAGGRRLFVLAGARSPDALLFVRELERWRRRPGVTVELIVDHALPGWRGQVGLITKLVETAAFDPDRTTAMACGPEVMMRAIIASLVGRGVAPARIRVSLERNMKCGIGWCGHCQLGPLLVCRDGPVVTADRIAPLLRVEEL